MNSLDVHACTVSDWKEKAGDFSSSTPLIPDHLSGPPRSLGVLLHGDLGKRVLRKLLQSGRAWSPADAAPKPGRGGCQRCCWGRGRAATGVGGVGADAPMGADGGSAGEHEKGERPPG